MVNKQTVTCIFSLTICFLSASVYADVVAPSSDNFLARQQTEFFGSQLGGNVTSGNNALNQLETGVNLNVLGIALDAFMAMSTPPNTIDGVTYTEVYSFGKRIFAGSITTDAANGGVSVGIAPTEVRVPVLEYPIGPMVLELDAGARFQANFSMQNMSVIGIPASLSSLGLTMEGAADAAGFVEGYAKLLVVRGGVGGQFDLVKAQANSSMRVSFDGVTPPLLLVSGIARFLSGEVYAFGDVYNIFAGGWSRFLNDSLYSWGGYCFSTGSLSCSAN